MKFLVIARPKDQAWEPGTLKEVEGTRALIRDFVERGIVERSYWLIGGGSAWIVNVESSAALARGLQGTGLARHSELEIHDVEPAVEYLESRAREMENTERDGG